MTDQPPDELAASPAQIATGLPVAADPTGTSCAHCGRPLRSGTPVSALLTRPAETGTWTIPAVACRDCPLTPPATRPAVVVAGTLTTCAQPRAQTHHLCLTADSHQSHRAYASPTPTDTLDTTP